MPATLAARLKGPWYAADSTGRARLWRELPESWQPAFRAHEAFFSAVAAGSDYLCDLLVRHAEDVVRWMEEEPGTVLNSLFEEIEKVGRSGDPNETGRLLRHIKPRAALLIAL